MNLVAWMKKYRGMTFAYIFLVMLIVAGFIRFETLADEQEREEMRRANLVCELSNDNRETLIYILDAVYSQPLAHEVGDEVREARERFLDEMHERLRPTNCPPNPDEVGEDGDA